MTVCVDSRARLALSSAPGMLRTPSLTQLPMADKLNDRYAGRLSQYELEKSYRADIVKAVNNDNNAIRDVRKSLKELPKFHCLTVAQQDIMLQEAALDKIHQRIQQRRHASHAFPAFKNYIPPIAYGRQSMRKADPERNSCIDHQLQLWREALTHERGKHHDDNEDDEEPIPFKKQEDVVKQEMSDIAAFDGKQEAQPFTGSDEHSAASQQTEHGTNPASNNKRKRAYEGDEEDSDDEDEDERVVTWHAISRGMPLVHRHDLPMPKLANVNLRQRFATGTTPCFERAVFRGQVPILDDSDED